MPEYLAPGVFVEEVSSRSKSIEGVSTTTTGFVGPTRYGPLEGPPDVVTSLVEFERTYGDRHQLDFGGGGPPMHNYMWHAARTFFEQGGKRLYVQRVFRSLDAPADGQAADGRAFAQIAGEASPPGTANQIAVRARFPGEAGRRRV